ncbi:MAG TPA: adenine phosphoribosyltransferase [Bacteroidota bacterium]|nr:adenine phosphoribosyltransferase [Bacteroidota bacterium]
MHELARHIRNIPDFPKKGIVFRDITTLLKEPTAFKKAVDILYERYRDKGISKIVCVEARGFILGGALAAQLGAGFVPIRKKGKLPAETYKEEYQLEYGIDTVEIHKDAIVRGERCLLHDDLLATGGTMLACANLVKKVGGEVAGICFLIELSFLNGREKLKGFDVHSIIQYESE